MKTATRLLVVDDHPVVRRGISLCLSTQKEFLIVGEAGNGVDALRLARELSPDVILMDIDMPRMDGLSVTEALTKELPQIKVLILSMHSDSEHVRRMMQAGARGCVGKEASTEELTRAIEVVCRGEAFFSSNIAREALNHLVRGKAAVVPGPESLTAREKQVLILIAQGFSNKEIAHDLGVGVRTVETHRERIMRKLDIHGVAGLTKFAVVHGLVGCEGVEQA